MPKINVHDGLLIAATKQTDSSKLRRQLKIKFKCSNPKCPHPRFGDKSKCWRCLFLAARWKRVNK